MLRATARIVEVDKELVRNWLDRATRQCRAVMLYLWRDFPATECQLDELWSFVHPSKKTCLAHNTIWTVMGRLGCGWPLPPFGGWCWGLSWANAIKPVPTSCLGKSLMLLTLISCRCLPVINGLPTPRRC